MATILCQEKTFKNIEAIIFDKDGTLENSEEFLRNLGQKRARLLDAQIPGIGDPLLMAYGIDGNAFDPTGLLAVGSRQENEIASAAYVAETSRGWLESLEITRRCFEEADQILKRSAPSPLFVGCLETLQFLAKAGLKLAILSADTTQRVHQFVQHYQLNPYIQVYRGVDQGPSKPDPTLFWEVCRTLGVEPTSALMVGDSPADIEMAKEAGAAGCVGICWNSPMASHLQAADVTISQLDQLQVIS